MALRRPVYLEVWENVWAGACVAPAGRIVPLPRPTTHANDVRSEMYRRLLIAFFAVFAVTMVVFLVGR